VLLSSVLRYENSQPRLHQNVILVDTGTVFVLSYMRVGGNVGKLA